MNTKDMARSTKTQTRIAKFVAQKLAHETGQRYCGAHTFKPMALVRVLRIGWRLPPKEECAKEKSPNSLMIFKQDQNNISKVREDLDHQRACAEQRN